MTTASNASWRFRLGREDAYQIFQAMAYLGVSYRELRSFRRALFDGGAVRDRERLIHHAAAAGVRLPDPPATRRGVQPANSDSDHWFGKRKEMPK